MRMTINTWVLTIPLQIFLIHYRYFLKQVRTHLRPLTTWCPRSECGNRCSLDSSQILWKAVQTDYQTIDPVPKQICCCWYVTNSEYNRDNRFFLKKRIIIKSLSWTVFKSKSNEIFKETACYHLEISVWTHPFLYTVWSKTSAMWCWAALNIETGWSF